MSINSSEPGFIRRHFVRADRATPPTRRQKSYRVAVSEIRLASNEAPTRLSTDLGDGTDLVLVYPFDARLPLRYKQMTTGVVLEVAND